MQLRSPILFWNNVQWLGSRLPANWPIPESLGTFEMSPIAMTVQKPISSSPSREALMRGTRFYKVLLLITIFVFPVAAQTAPPAVKSGDPQPEAAINAIISSFDTFRIVAVGDRHGTKDLNDFVLSLIRHPAFTNTVNDIVVECANSLYQVSLDRYIAGEDLPVAEVRRLWRDQTHPPCSVDGFHEQLFQLVRRINQTLPPGKALRVLAGEPPIEWRTLNPQ